MVGTVMETTKEKIGADAPKVMAYTAKKKALEYVLGDREEEGNFGKYTIISNRQKVHDFP